MLVQTNLETKRVVMFGSDPGGGWYEVSLTWSQAALLATMLNEGSREIEPVLTFGKTYYPVVKPDRR